MIGLVPENLQAAIYIRVSTDKQAEEGFGLDLQEKECRETVAYNRWNFVKLYKDDGYSGMLPANERPAMKELLEDARDDKFNIVVVYSLDRIGRTLSIITEIVDELERFKIGVAAKRNNFDTSTPMGKFTMQIIGGVAELDRKALIEKMTKGRTERRKQKGYSGGLCPYGYRLIDCKNEKKKEIDINKLEACVVRKIFAFKAEGLGPTQIASKLNEEGIAPKKAMKWSRQTIYKILSRKADYEGGLMNNNVNGITWPKIL